MAKRTRLYFATDLHGSSKCFRKFLNAGPTYGADILILGADLGGKAIQGIVRGTAGRWHARFVGTIVLTVLNPIRISIRAAIRISRACLLGACIDAIRKPIPVPVALADHGTPAMRRNAGLGRALVLNVGDAISITIRATTCGLHARLFRTRVRCISHHIIVAVGERRRCRFCRI